MELLCCIIGAIIGALIVYIVSKPKLKAAQQLDLETLERNQKLQSELSSLEAHRDELKRSLVELQEQASKSAETLYQKSLDLANEQLSNSAENLSYNFQKYRQSCEQEYLNTLKECAESFQSQINEKAIELKTVESQLEDLRSRYEASVAASKRAEEMRDQQNYYRLNLSPLDLEEIAKLREVTPYLRNSEPLNKVIWKVYYEKPYTDLIGRVVGTGIHVGIYKITNIENQKCYIGQSVNISDRWKQHIKRGIGAEPPTQNKLYAAMLEAGVENFTFEIVEECERSQLNEREDYWQDYFKAKEFGYSIK